MKYLVGMLCCSLMVAMVGDAMAAEIIIREYPDRIEAECDGSQDPQPAMATEREVEQAKVLQRNELRNSRVRSAVADRMEMNRMRIEANQKALEERKKAQEEQLRGGL